TDPALVVAVSPNNTPVLPSGAATSANQTNGSQKTQVVDGSGNVQNAGDAAARALFIKATDGTNTAAVKAASTAAVATGPALVVAVSPNNTPVLPNGAATSANQTNASQKTQVVDGSGNVSPAGDTVARARFEQISDGTTGPVAVKAASTAAVAADKALVV